jgi:hypothetical protein
MEIHVGDHWIRMMRIDTRHKQIYAGKDMEKLTLYEMPLLDRMADNKNLIQLETIPGWLLFFVPLGQRVPQFDYARFTIEDVAGTHWISDPLKTSSDDLPHNLEDDMYQRKHFGKTIKTGQNMSKVPVSSIPPVF